VCIIVFPPFDFFLYFFNPLLYTWIPHLKVLQDVLLASVPSSKKRLLCYI
jgi:hypothetical protein